MLGINKETLNLRKLILFICIFSVSMTLFNAFFSIYQVQREQIIRDAMEANHTYAQKMAEVAEVFTESLMRQVEYSAGMLGSELENKELVDKELNRLQEQPGVFNSTVLVDKEGYIIATSKNITKAEGVKLKDKTLLQTLSKVQPFISKSFLSPKGNYLISISHPIFSEGKEYIGYIGGTIHLKDNNVLKSLLDNHSVSNGSFLYVVDNSKTVIYHPDQTLIGKIVDNDAVKLVLDGNKGSIETVGYFGEEVIAGYSPVHSTGWGVIIERPKSVSLDILEDQVHSVFWRIIPLSLLTFIFIWVTSATISKPLSQLASSINRENIGRSESVNLIKIKPWFFEAFLLKKAVIKTFADVSNTIEKLNNDRLTDVMTGLTNRRGFEEALDELQERKSSFSIMAIDIDFFKKVNDTYGHDIGDKVLRELSNLIKSQSRKSDILCRIGGEEFIVLMSEMSVENAFMKAERFRQNVEQHKFEHIGNLTISIGVSRWVGAGQSIHMSIKKADDALYKAKRHGRNRCVINL